MKMSMEDTNDSESEMEIENSLLDSDNEDNANEYKHKKPMSDLVLKLGLGECESSFSLENAVCNHGFFMMAPNNWIPSAKTLQRPLRLSDSTTSVMVSISHPPNHSFISVKVHDLDTLYSTDQEAILKQVSRMLRISKEDEKDVREFQTMHGEAKDKGFGRIFRSPSLFEDAVKAILLCNCTWKRSLDMAQAFCELQQKLIDLKPIGKRARYIRNHAANISGKRVKGQVTGNFPSAEELASLDEDFLKQHCKVGYRSKRIIQLAKEYIKGTSLLNEIEEMLDSSTISYGKVHRKLLKIKGFGPFASATVMMCIGCYEYVTIDSETIRLLRKVHATENCTEVSVKKDVKGIYEKYEPFQSLAYWFELLYDYEDQVGKLSELPHSSYHSVSGTGKQHSLGIIEARNCGARN